MDTKIISYEDYVKQNKKSDITKAVNEYNELKAKVDYINTKKAADEAQKTIKTAIKDEKTKLGVTTPTLAPLATTNNTGVLDTNTGRLKLQSAYETNQQNLKKYTEETKKNNELVQNSPTINALNNLSQEVNNQKLLSKYNYEAAKEANHDITLWDKTGGVVTRAVSDFLNPEKLDSSNYYVNNGNRMVLPTASQIRQQNVSASYDTDTLGGKIGKFATDVGYNLTKIGLSSAINMVAPYAGSTLYFSDMASDSFNQAKLDGYDDKSAALFSVLGVASEMLTEKVLGGFSKLTGGESVLSTRINRVLGKVLKNDRLRSALSNAFSEGTEEFVQEFVERLNRNLILDKKSLGEAASDTFNWDVVDDAIYSAIVGMGSGGLMGATNVEIDTNNTGVVPAMKKGKIDVNTYVNDLENAKAKTKNQQKINNINQVLDNINQANTLNDTYMQYAQRLANDEANNRNFREQINNNTNNEIDLTNNMPSELQQLGVKGDNLKIERNIVNKAMKSGLSQDVVETIPTSINHPSYVLDNGQNGVTVISELNNNNNVYSVEFNVDYNGNITDINIEANPVTTDYLKTTLYPRIRESENNGTLLYDYVTGMTNNTNQAEVLPGNGNLSVLPRANENNTNNNATTEKLQYVKTANPKVNNVYNTASKYFDNSQQSINFVDTVAKVAKDKGYNIVFDDTNMNGINGKIESKNGEVTMTLNPYSPRALEFVLVHEITHAIETNSMKNMIMKYAESNPGFKEALESLKQTYKTNDVSSEVIADISGQLLGNQEFINNLSMEKPNLFKQLYNNIKAWYHKLRGWKSQNEFLEDLMNKWEYAYATQQDNLKKNMVDYNLQENQNGYKYDIEEGWYENINKKKTKIPDNLIPYLVVDPTKAEYLAYTQNEDYFKMSKQDMDYIAEEISNDISQNFTNGEKYGTIMRDDLVIKYQVYDDNNFGVRDINNYAKEGNIYEREVNRTNSSLPTQQQSIEQGTNSINNGDIENSKTSSNNAGLVENTGIEEQSIYTNNNKGRENSKGELDNSSFSFDDEGRKLSKQQQNYFKNSKVRDSDGKLKTLYHGTPNYDFYEFAGGTFLTDDYWNADGYASGERIIESYVNMENPLVVDCKGAKWDNIDSEYGSTTQEIASNLDESKYDGVIFENVNDAWYDDENGDVGTVYYVPNSNQIKETDNTKPTSKADIRYSKQNENWQDYIEDNYKNEGTKTNINIVNQAKSDFGTTNNLNEAGYLTVDGEYLDFSGKNQGAKGGTRTLDHRDIADSYSDSEYTAAEKKYSNMGSNTAVMQDFIDRGNIRLTGTGVEIATSPTETQYNQLYDYLEYVQKNNGEVFIDLDTETKNKANLEYNDKTSVRKMINDIKNHYESIQENKTNNTLKGDNILKTKQEVTKTNDLNEYIADAAVRQEQQNIADRQAIREMIEQYVEENDIKNPTLEQLQNSMDDYNMFDNMEDMSELQKAEKLYKEVAKEIYDEKYAKTNTSKVDNQGRTLSKQQQEYFKDSKIRDNNGNLLALYHGTRSDFTVFDITKSGESSKQGKVGFWFTETKEGAENFGNSVWYGQNKNAKAMEVYLDVKNPKIYDVVDNTTKLKQLETKRNKNKVKLNEIKNKYGISSFYTSYDGEVFLRYAGMYGSKYSNYTDADLINYIKSDFNLSKDIRANPKEYLKDIKQYDKYKKAEDNYYHESSILRYNDPYEQFRSDIYALAGMDAEDANIGGTGKALDNENEIVNKYVSQLKEAGYDGIIIKSTNYDTNTMGEKNNQYVAFYPNQIKNVDNTSPTTNEDIRYSKNNQSWQKYLEDNYKATGTRTYAKDILSRENANNKATDHYITKKAMDNGEKPNKLKGDNVLKSVQEQENVPEWVGTTADTELLSQNAKYNREHNLNELNDMNQYVDSNNHVFAIPDDVALKLIEKTNIDASMISDLDTILKNATETTIKGDKIEVKSDWWDNSTLDITAEKQGNTYVIDDIKKVAKSESQITQDMDNYKNVTQKKATQQTTQNENTNNDFMTFQQAANETIQKARQNYKETAENATNLKESKFYKNATETSKFINEENRNNLSKIGDLKYYEGVTNEESLTKASKKLQQGGEREALTWLNKDAKTSDSVDVAEGWILLQNYQDQGNYEAMVEVAKKMREMGTKAGQAVQAYNIMARLTPEGMVKYAQNQLGEAFDIFAKNKSKSWLEQNESRFDLTPQEVGFIVDTMKQVQNMEDGRAKNVKIGEIQSMLENKLPPERGAGIKAWMRTSMLLNPKTQIRNVLGNAVITPVNMVGDYISSKVDAAIAKKTGVRTTGTTDIQSYLKGFKKGLYESYDDFKRGINTRDVNGNRFEIGQGKSFNDNTTLGKTLNKLDSLNSFLLDFGDRGFYEAAFTNSINNQLALNNKTTVTQDMIDIATSEALQRTWQDNNNYTKFVLQTRNGLNKINVKGYGLGDVLIPFAKTPANLTKAIVDYSPAGLVYTLMKQGRDLKNNIETGKATAMEQHQFVQNLGKATAGTMLYVAAYGLAKAGIATGKSDDDKDTRDFIKNTLGINSYSIKIGDKSFTYDWAQPIAAPLSIMTNIVNSKNNKGQALLEAITSSLDSAGSILLEQSFLKSINEVLTDNDGVVSGIEKAILDLPTRAIPTFMKQIADMTDGTQRQTFEYKQPLKTALNKVKAKIPGLSQTLSPSVDTMGREIQKYGGKNNIFNVFLNPANVNTENISEGAAEIYRVYKQTGDKTIIPRVAKYHIDSKNEKTILNTEQRKNYQKISGNIIEESMQELLNNKNYKEMTDSEKANVINKIVDYSDKKAQQEVLGMETSISKTLENWLQNGGTVASYYANKEEADFSVNSPVKYQTIQNMGVDYYDYKEYQEKVNEIKNEYSGTANTNVRKQKVFEYINSLNLNKNEKIILFKMLGNYSIKNYSSSIYNYINNFNLTAKEKQEIWNSLF